MFCPYCGNPHLSSKGNTFINAFAEGDEEKTSAVEQVADQIKEEKDKEFKDLLSTKKDSLKVEDVLVQRMEKSLSQAKSSLVSAIKEVLRQGKGGYLLTLSPEQLNNYLLEKGLGESLKVFSDAQLDVRDLVVQSVKVFSPSFSTQNLNLFPLLRATTSETLFDGILSATAKTVKESLLTAATTQNTKLAINQLEENLKKASGDQIAEARTKISEMNRSLTATAAEAANLKYFYYAGPKDQVTRPFCRKLVGKVVSASDINKLNNGVAGSSALIQGGGYNCRHSWTAVSKEFCERLNLQILSSSEVKQI